MKNKYKREIGKYLLLNERVESWWYDDYDENDIILTVYTYKGNKIVFHLSVNRHTRIDELIYEIEKELEKGDK